MTTSPKQQSLGRSPKKPKSPRLLSALIYFSLSNSRALCQPREKPTRIFHLENVLLFRQYRTTYAGETKEKKSSDSRQEQAFSGINFFEEPKKRFKKLTPQQEMSAADRVAQILSQAQSYVPECVPFSGPSFPLPLQSGTLPPVSAHIFLVITPHPLSIPSQGDC